MRIEQFEFLLAVADNYSMKKAADMLHTSAQNVSKVIKQLEEEINTPIFIRNKYGVFLTKEGEFVYYKAQEIINRVREIETHYNTRQTTSSQSQKLIHLNILSAQVTIRDLSVIYDQICEKLSPITSSLIEKDAQDINLLIETDLTTLFQRYDMIVSNATLTELNRIKSKIIDFQCYCLRKDCMGICVNATNPLASLDSVSIKDVLSYPLILAQPNETTYSHLHTAIEGLGIKLNPRYTVNSYDTLRHLLQNTDGYALAIMLNDTKFPGTITIPFKENIFFYNMIIINPTLSKSENITFILNALKKQFPDIRPLY